MPITKSAKKSLRQDKKRHGRNVQRKKAIKVLVKKINTLLTEKKAKEASLILPQLYKALDKAAKKHTLKKNTAARQKSRFAKLINKTAKSA